MNARVVRRDADGFSVTFDVKREESFSACEMEIQAALNEAGVVATAEALKGFDTRGEPFERQGTRYTSKGETLRQYQTPYGIADLERHVYQSPQGGATRCPLDDKAGILLSATPRLAQMVAAKYADFGSARVQFDLESNHGRHLSRGFIEELAGAVALIARGVRHTANYRLPDFGTAEMSVLMALTAVPIEGMNEPTMRVGIASFGLYDTQTEKQFVVYLAEIFESDPAPFLRRVEREAMRIRRALYKPRYFGITAGEDWAIDFLKHLDVERQVVDPRWLLDRVGEAISHIPADQVPERRKWLGTLRRKLRTDPNWKDFLSEGLNRWRVESSSAEEDANWRQIRDEFDRHQRAGLLEYREPLAGPVLGSPGILAEVTHVLLGNRFLMTRMRTGIRTAEMILTLREMTRNPDRWKQFWDELTSGRFGLIDSIDE